MPDDERPPGDDVPLAELDEADRARRAVRAPRLRRTGALALVVALVGAGTLVAMRRAHDDNRVRRRVEPSTHRSVKTVDDGKARADVLSALRVTTGSGSFKIHYHLSESPATSPTTTTFPAPCGQLALAGDSATTGAYPAPNGGGQIDCGFIGSATHGVAISGDGVVTVHPTAMVTSSEVPGLGLITTRINGTDVWEEGGGNYGMAAGSGTVVAPGGPLSQFAGLVLGTLGRRAGAVAMSNMASPTGYLDLAQQAITATSKLGDGVVDGIAVHDYEVTIGLSKDRAGLTEEEVKTAAAAEQVLADEGYRTTTVRLSIDGLGFIRRAQTVVTFADGGTVNADTTFSDFGCSTTVMTPKGPSIVPDPSACAPAAPTAGTPTSTAAPDSSGTTSTTFDPMVATSTTGS